MKWRCEEVNRDGWGEVVGVMRCVFLLLHKLHMDVITVIDTVMLLVDNYTDCQAYA